MKKKLFIFAIVLLTIFNLTAISTVAYMRWSRGGFPMPPGERGECEMRFFDRIGLDKEQRQHMRDSRREFFESTHPLADHLDRLRKSLFEAMHEESPDTTLIFGLVDSIGDIQSQLHRRAITYMLEEGRVLTPRQRRELFGILEGEMGRHREKRGHWGRRCGDGRRPGPPIGMIGLVGSSYMTQTESQESCAPEMMIENIMTTEVPPNYCNYNCNGMHREKTRQSCNKIVTGNDKSPEGGI